jgi:site-specific recombinase XerD
MESQEAEPGASVEQQQPVMREESSPPCKTAVPATNELRDEENQEAQRVEIRPLMMTIERAIQVYLQEQMDRGYRRKTLEWHQTALQLLQHYLVKQRHLGFLRQLTESEVRRWLAFLRTPSSDTGILRKASTIATYGRSVRAFCHWAVRKGYLERTPMARGILPKAEKKRIQLIEPDVFDRLLLACRPAGERRASLDRVAARNQSILWVLMDTGMRVSELCGLRLSDVNREQRSLRVQRRGNECWLALSPNGWFHLLSYLEQSRPKEGFSAGEPAQQVPLFFSETYKPLTINALTLLFGRLRKRAGIIEEQINPSLLRDTFAVRYLQAGGEPEALRAILGLTGMESVKRYEQLSIQKIENGPRKELTEEHSPRLMTVPQKSRSRRRRSSSAVTKKLLRPGADKTHRTRKKKLTTDAEEGP